MRRVERALQTQERRNVERKNSQKTPMTEVISRM